MKSFRLGLSLSKCALDIYRGEVEIERVVAIVSGTRIDEKSYQSLDSLKILAESYIGYNPHWNLNPSEAGDLAKVYLTLFKTGRVLQPRLFTGDWQSPFSHHGFHWLDLMVPIEHGSHMSEAYDEFITMARLGGNQQAGVFEVSPIMELQINQTLELVLVK